MSKNLAVGVAIGIFVATLMGFVAGLPSVEAKDVAGVFAGVLGGILGALGAAGAVYLTFEGQRRIVQDANQALIKALWNDATSLLRVAHGEAQWWRREADDQRIGATQSRLLDHFDLAVFDANLHRIGDIPIRAADSLLTLRSHIALTKSMHKAFYDVEDRILSSVRKVDMPQDEAMHTLRVNKIRIFEGLARIAAAARNAARALDPDGTYDAERRATFSPEEWEIVGPEFERANDFADQMLERQRAGVPPF